MPKRKETKRSRGRPVEYPLPPPIPATPEELARAVANTPPPKEWEYMKKHPKKDRK